jgi:hypothetical protein
VKPQDNNKRKQKLMKLIKGSKMQKLKMMLIIDALITKILIWRKIRGRV